MSVRTKNVINKTFADSTAADLFFSERNSFGKTYQFIYQLETEPGNVYYIDETVNNPILLNSSPGVPGSSTLFPNGLSEEPVSRMLTSDDIGKLLIIVNDGVILTPEADMVESGDLPKEFGIWCLNPTTKTSGFKVNIPSEICYLESATAFDGATGIGEIVSFISLYDDELEISNMYPITDMMLSNEFTGTVGQLVIPYLLEQSQNAKNPRWSITKSESKSDADFTATAGKAYILPEVTEDRFITFDTPEDGDIYRFNNTAQPTASWKTVDSFYLPNGTTAGTINPESIVIIQYDAAQGRFNIISSQ